MLEVTPIPCLKDNYAYAVRRAGSSEVVVVDACEEAPVVEFLESRGLKLVAILSTHHHADHVGGNLALSARYGASVFGHAGEISRIPGITRLVRDGEFFELLGEQWKALHVPGHTRGAICYIVGERAFTGDTLFVGGCGRLFEGTPAEMNASLRRIAALSDETLLYSGHEYALGNLTFAAALLPESEEISSRLAEVRQARERGLVMAITTVRVERETNVFLRVRDGAVRAALGCPATATDDDVFAELRHRKNIF